jgi:hypothetical protein
MRIVIEALDIGPILNVVFSSILVMVGSVVVYGFPLAQFSWGHSWYQRRDMSKTFAEGDSTNHWQNTVSLWLQRRYLVFSRNFDLLYTIRHKCPRRADRTPRSTSRQPHTWAGYKINKVSRVTFEHWKQTSPLSLSRRAYPKILTAVPFRTGPKLKNHLQEWRNSPFQMYKARMIFKLPVLSNVGE